MQMPSDSNFRVAQAKFDVESFKTTPEGYLDAAVYPTRAGVFNYYYGGKLVRELRRPEEVFKADSLDSLKNKAVTNDHPRDEMGNFVFLDARNTRRYDVGTVYGEHRPADDGIHTQSRVIIKDEQTINAVKSGKVQVSCGYTCDYLEQPGEWNGLAYDREQVNIRDYNHLAIVDRGRAGSGAAIKFDGAEVDPAEPDITEGEQTTVVKTKLDGAEIEVSESAVEAIVKADSVLQTMPAIVTERDELKGKLDALSAELEQYKAKEQQAAKQALISKAAAYLPEQKLDGMSEREIKEAVIKSKFDSLDLGAKNDAEISGMFEIVLAQPVTAPAETDNKKKLDAALDNPKPNQGKDLISVARQQQIKSARGF